MTVKTIADLKPDVENARQHNPCNIGMIADSLQEVGAARSIVIDEDNIIIAGNGVIEAAAQVGIENVRIIEADGNEIIAVRRSGLTPEQKRRLAYYDNRTAELATWDAGQIVADLEAGIDLSDLFRDDELARLGLGDSPVDPVAEWQGMPAFEQDDAFGAVVSIHVHFATVEDIKAFAVLVEQTVTDRTKYIWYPRQERANLKAYLADES